MAISESGDFLVARLPPPTEAWWPLSNLGRKYDDELSRIRTYVRRLEDACPIL